MSGNPAPIVAEVIPITPAPAVIPPVDAIAPVVIPAGSISKKEYIIAGLIIVTIIGVAIYIASQKKDVQPQRGRNPNIQ